MGKELAENFCAENLSPTLQVLWIDNALSEAQTVGRVTPGAPLLWHGNDGAHGVTRPTIHRLTKML